MAFAEDLSMYDDTNGFAVTATYTPQVGGAVVIKGVFDKEYVEPLGVTSSGPAFTTRTANVPNPKHGETLLVNGTTYRIVTPQPDGLGVTVLLLQV